MSNIQDIESDIASLTLKSTSNDKRIKALEIQMGRKASKAESEDSVENRPANFTSSVNFEQTPTVNDVDVITATTVLNYLPVATYANFYFNETGPSSVSPGQPFVFTNIGAISSDNSISFNTDNPSLMTFSRAGVYSITYFFNYINNTNTSEVALYINNIQQGQTILKTGTGVGQLCYEGIFGINVGDSIALKNIDTTNSIQLATNSTSYSMTAKFLDYIPSPP